VLAWFPLPPNSIALAWWNTSLAPGGRSRGDAVTYRTAAEVLWKLLGDEAVDLLALGEVSAVDVEACREATAGIRSGLRWHTPSARLTRGSALAVVYDSSKLILRSDILIIDRFAGVGFVTGWHLSFESVLGGDALNVVVVHWPSHIIEEAARKRSWIAASLHRAFSSYRDVVILGDFNDEPFCESLRDGLAAYRDRDLVRRREEAFYNPFWRLLGEQQHLEDEATNKLPAGTHFYRSGTATRWYTYDQIIVSSGLVMPDHWRLTEGATRVVLPSAILAEDGTMRSPFDHLPVATSFSYTP